MRTGDEALSLALLRGREAIVRYFRPLTDPHQMTPQQWLVIRALGDFGELSAMELAERSALMPPSCSRIVKTLRKRGLVSRVADGDGRRRKVELTEGGWAVYHHMAPAVEAAYQELEDAFGKDRMEELRVLLVDLREVLEAAGARSHEVEPDEFWGMAGDGDADEGDAPRP